MSDKLAIPKINKSDVQKWGLIIITGSFVGFFTGLLESIAFFIIVFIVSVFAAYKYYKVKKGDEIKPYSLMDQIKYAAGGIISAIAVYSLFVEQYLVGIFLCFGFFFLAYALIHFIRTDVLAMDN